MTSKKLANATKDTSEILLRHKKSLKERASKTARILEALKRESAEKNANQSHLL